jgi:hypothetical protein
MQGADRQDGETMRFARWMGMGLLAFSLMGCGNRFASVNYSNLANYARPVRPAQAVTTQAMPTMDIGRPVALAFDRADNLLVANNKGGSILAVTARGEALEKADNLPDPSAMTVSRGGNIYVSCFKDGTIVRMNEKGVKRIANALTGLRSVAVTSDESLYVTLPQTREVIEIKPDGTRQTIWKHASFVPELITATGKDELFLSVQDGQRGRLLQISRKGKQLDEFTFDNHLTAVAADPKGRLFVATAAMNDDDVAVGELGWLDRNGDWTILAENVVKPLAVAVTPGGMPIYVHYDGAKNRYEIVTLVGDSAAPWLAAS